MKKLFIAILTVVILGIVGLNYDELYSMFYSQFSKEIQGSASKIDFTIGEDLLQQQNIDLSELSRFDEGNIAVYFDIKNTSTCDIYVRVAILPIILDKSDTNTAYKLKKSSCEIQYCSENNNLDDDYWTKSEDGYYYYKKDIKKGECLENKLISGVKLRLSKAEKVDLRDKQFQIAIRVESRQCEF